jgi:hypothetical protein
VWEKDDFANGFVWQTSKKLMEVLPTTAKNARLDAGELPLPTLQAVTKLNEIATSKLAEIVRRSSSGEKGWDGYNAAEVAAARELLSQGVPQVSR